MTDWFTSSHGGGVEVRRVAGGWLVRHSDTPDEGVVAVTDDAWRAFLAGVKADEFDRPVDE